MGKVTVKHYLNKTIKPRIEGNTELYPLYVQVIANRTNYRFKSSFPFNDGYIREIDLDQEFVKSCNETERKEIEKIVGFLQEKEDIKLTSDYIRHCFENLWSTLNKNFGALFEKECEDKKLICPSVLLEKDYYDISEVLNFTETDIERKFSDKYQKCKIGLNAIYRGLFDEDDKDGNLRNMNVFDFIHGNGHDIVLNAVKKDYGIHGGNEENEYESILAELKKMISI